MNNNIKDILHRVAEQTFESLAFMLAMPEIEGQPEPDSWTTVSVGFGGHFGGRLMVAVSTDMLPELAGNMLGVMDDTDEAVLQQQKDALMELANVICGNLLPEIAGVEVVFDVDAPELVNDSAAEPNNGEHLAVAETKLCLDGGLATVQLFADAGAIEALGLYAQPTAG